MPGAGPLVPHLQEGKSWPMSRAVGRSRALQRGGKGERRGGRCPGVDDGCVAYLQPLDLPLLSQCSPPELMCYLKNLDLSRNLILGQENNEKVGNVFRIIFFFLWNLFSRLPIK